MKKSTRLLLAGATAGGGIAAFTYLTIVRPWHLHWGATPEEIDRALPMDDAVHNPTAVTTRAITINAPPAQIWPWLVQMGEAPRGGFYSYECVERLLGMQVRNADTLLPECQEIRVGDALDHAGNMIVRGMHPGQWLVLGPPRGALDGGDATWCIYLDPQSDGSTRLISRCRARLPRTLAGLCWSALLDPGQFVMERKWLQGIKERAESSAPHRVSLPECGEPVV